MTSSLPPEFTWLWGQPNGAVAPPVATTIHRLPLTELGWENFERLCLRILQIDHEVEHAQGYGVPGQNQHGIDLFARVRTAGTYIVCQCKKYEELKPSIIDAAVARFESGIWASKAASLILATSAEIEPTEIANRIIWHTERLAEKNILLSVRGHVQLSDRLRKEPNIVDDFFGREWVRGFCGQGIAEQLARNRPLSSAEMAELRAMLRRHYAAHFHSVDPGLLAAARLGTVQGPGIVERYVAHDVIEREIAPPSAARRKS